MKKNFYLIIALLLIAGCTEEKKEANPVVTNSIENFSTPESVEAGDDGVYYVSNIGGFGVPGDGSISVIENNSVRTLAAELNDPKGLSYRENSLFVSDNKQIWKIDKDGNKTVFVDSADFPENGPIFLNDLSFDGNGNLYVTDSGDFETIDGAIYKISPDAVVSTFINFKNSPEIHSPNGIIFDENNNILVTDFGTGKLLRISSDGKNLEILSQDAKQGDGLAYDSEGYLYLSDWDGGKIFKFDENFNATVLLDGFDGSADITIDKDKDLLLIPEFNSGKVTYVTLY